jgi:hypothetical protein
VRLFLEIVTATFSILRRDTLREGRTSASTGCEMEISDFLKKCAWQNRWATLVRLILLRMKS